MPKTTNLQKVVALGQDGGSTAFKVTAFDGKKGTVTIKYGILNVNSQFVASSVTIGGSIKLTDVKFGSFIYLRINNIFSRTERATVEFFADNTEPEEIKVPAKPFPSVICLAWIDSATGKIYDLRPAYIISVFSFLG